MSNFNLNFTVLFDVSQPVSLFSFRCSATYLGKFCFHTCWVLPLCGLKSCENPQRRVTFFSLLRRGPLESLIPPVALDWDWIDHNFMLWVCGFYFSQILLHFRKHCGLLFDVHTSMSDYKMLRKGNYILKRHIHSGLQEITHQYSFLIVRIQSQMLEPLKEFNFSQSYFSLLKYLELLRPRVFIFLAFSPLVFSSYIWTVLQQIDQTKTLGLI